MYNMSLQGLIDRSRKRMAWLEIAKELNLDDKILFLLYKADRPSYEIASLWVILSVIAAVTEIG